MNTVLFLCTGNYYRSRFAEIIFNHLAPQHQLPWQATSAGLRVGYSQSINPGPFSPHAYVALLSRGFALPPLPPIPADHPLSLVPLTTPVTVPMAKSHSPNPIPDAVILRPSRQVAEADLAAAHLTIALKESEHRPLMLKLHPAYAEKITYWNIHDLDCATPGEALAILESQLHRLLAELGQK